MFHKARRRLTLLFTTVCCIILTVMTFLYLYLSTRNLLDNEFTSFESNVSSYVTNFESRTVISYDWLAKLENSQQYRLFLYDNNSPFLYNTIAQDQAYTELAANLLQLYDNQLKEYAVNHPFSSYHLDFAYQSKEGLNYYIGIGRIPRSNGFLTLVVLYPLDNIYHQLHRLYLQSAGIIIATCILLFLFSYYYTGHLLAPLEENQLRQTQFIAAASHELRTPLAAIQSSLDAARIADLSEQKHFLDASLSETKRLSTLVNDMLKLAQSDLRMNDLNLKPQEPDTLLLEVYEAFFALAHEHALALHIKLPKDAVAPHLLDYDKIYQVLSILIYNAISYTPAGGRITLSLQSDSRHIIFLVEDNGRGIAPKDRSHLFERFYRGDQSRSTKDGDTTHYGLGLSIASEIIKAHKGSISFMDTPGGGTTFQIII